MCGRYLLDANGDQYLTFLQKTVQTGLFGSVTRLEWVVQEIDNPPYNPSDIRPTDFVPIGFASDDSFSLTRAHWGLAPRWAAAEVEFKQTKSGRQTFAWKDRPRAHFNSRLATLTRSKGWQRMLSHQKCIIVANGFYEWSDSEMLKPGEKKQKGAFTLRDRELFAFAGVYDILPNGPDGNPFYTFSIITVDPNEMLRALPHHRMPAMLTGDKIAQWLGSRDWEDSAGLLGPIPDEKMSMSLQG